MPEHGQTFQFVMLNVDFGDGGRPRPDKTTLTRARAHVMNNYIRQVRSTSQPGDVLPTAAVSSSIEECKDRFKTSSWKGRRKRDGLPAVSMKGRAGTEKPDIQTSQLTHEHKQALMTREPSSGCIDPFSSLPIDTSSKENNQLLRYYERDYLQNSLAFETDKRMVSLVMEDNACMSSMLSIVALNYSFRSGQNPSPHCFALRGTAISILKERLENLAPNIMREMALDIMEHTVGLLASFSIFDVSKHDLLKAQFTLLTYPAA
ncbi:hypothetical protein BP5796_06445 [Coleophoma crateriformis]|uniref:Transcription factor domain-containing protein n=1 Tax=Coleophoma crateriformis TaxID=565419 RepID=A0A3D8RP03_9HELO|nr:hypothetical protein BP5796_06445 [Coleophoma crateriformis]